MSKTLTKVNKEPVVLEASLVRQTDDVVVRRPWALPDVPIVVSLSGKWFYILDGNHRFVADVQMKRQIKAWVLTGQDRRAVQGAMTGKIRSWVDGDITFNELRRSSVEAHKSLRYRWRKGERNESNENRVV